MKKYLHLALLLFVFAGFAKAQGPQSTANWFGYILPPNPAANKYISFTLQDLGSVSLASDEHPQAVAATFADGYVWCALHDGSNSYDPTCLFMTYSSNPTEFTVGDLIYHVNDDQASVTVIGHVDGYEATGDLIIPESVSYEGHNYTVTTIGESAFLYCFYLTNLSIPNTVTTIEASAFAYCQGFTGDLVIPNSVTTVGYGAFQYCSGYDGNLIIGSSVTTIEDYAFNSCDGMTGTLYIPSGVQSLGGNSFGYCAFSGIVVDPENSVYDSRNDCNAIIETSTNELLTGCKNTVIPDGVTAIGFCAFRGVTGLTSIVIPESVTVIGENAFAFCYDLTGDLTIPNSVETIGPSAFFDCQSLDGTLTIGESVTFIGDWAFRNCYNITAAVSLTTTPPALGDEFGGMVFENFGTPTLTVPCGCIEAYRNSSWYEPTGMNGFSEFIEDCTAVSETGNIVTAVYPNPTDGMIKVEAENMKSISIFNMLGEKVFEVSVDGDTFEYDFSNQRAGVYLIKVETPKGNETIRVTAR